VKKWKKIDESMSVPYLEPDDFCIFARDYYPYYGYQEGETNSLIFNFKKPISAKGTNQWKHREKAVNKFANEASEIIPLNKKIYVTAIPSSLAKSDENYNFKFEDFFTELKIIRPEIKDISPITIIKSTQASHYGGAREIDEILTNYKWTGMEEPNPEFILLFDDVITTGAHFKAFQKFLKQNGFMGKVYGIFWAKSFYNG